MGSCPDSDQVGSDDGELGLVEASYKGIFVIPSHDEKGICSTDNGPQGGHFAALECPEAIKEDTESFVAQVWKTEV